MASRRALRAESVAQELLSEQGFQTQLPVPVEEIASRLGVVIHWQRFGADDVSGLLLREPGQAAVIGVNADNAKSRQRFTIAHELGHYLLHEGKRLVLDRSVRVNFRDSASSLATDVEEMQANAFAAGLLMPADAVTAELERIVQGKACSDDELVDRLARTCQVSRSAMEFRLINLGLFTPN